RGHVRGLKPPGEISDRFEVEGAMFMVDHAVIEAGGLDNPGDAARRELLKASAKCGPSLAHCAPYAVVFHRSFEAPFMRHGITNSTRDPHPRGCLISRPNLHDCAYRPVLPLPPVHYNE